MSLENRIMAINYFNESGKYRPEKIGKTIKILLVSEAPPSSGTTYFYVPRRMSDRIPIQKDRSLPATIFNHYFGKRPTTIDEYVNFLVKLQEKGIFLIDICDEPIKVRGNPNGIQRIIREIPKLRTKMEERKINIADEDIVFLLARNSYIKYIRREFPNSKFIRWIDFRISRTMQ